MLARKMLVSIVSIAALLISGCKGVPNAYLGEYQDSTGNVRVELSSTEGTIRLADGRRITSKLEELKFDLLKEGKRALYARENSRVSDLIEIFMIEPNMSTRQESGGLIWYNAEIIFSMIKDKDATAAKNLTLVHCIQGTVLLDTVTSRIQLGCPANPERIELKKTRDQSPPGGGGDWGGGG